MPFECKKYHCTCNADCCGVVPIPKKTWIKNQHLLQQSVLNEKEISTKRIIPEILIEIREISIIPITKNLKCPFLKKNLSCAIYEERPEVCEKFGDESHPMLICPMQDKKGNPR